MGQATKNVACDVYKNPNYIAMSGMGQAFVEIPN